MAKNDENPKMKMIRDALRTVMPIAIPFAVKELMALVPEGSRIDDFFRRYKDYWGKVSPAVLMLVMQLTNLHDFADDVLSELGAEVAKTIKEKYSDADGEFFKNPKKEKGAEYYPFSYALTSLSKDELVTFTKLIQTLPAKQGKRILGHEAGSKSGTDKLLKNLCLLDEDQFKAWADITSPVEAPRAETALEKAVKTGLNEFADDSKNYFQRDSFFTKLAKRKGLM